MSRDMATMRRTSTNKQHSGPTGTSTSFIGATDYAPSKGTASNSSRRHSLSAHRSLQGEDLRAHLGIHNAVFGSAQDFIGNQYDSAYESERGGYVGHQESQMSSSVFGSEGASMSARDRRRRMSLGSQMELLQSQIEAQVQPRPKSFMTTSATSTRKDSLVIRTAPSSRSNSVPKVRTVEEYDLPCPPGSARALHFDRVCESMPNFKPSEVKPDFYSDSQEYTHRLSTAQSMFESNCRPTVRPVSKSESHTPIPQSPRGKASTPTKYLSARAVAERLAKAIRGGSKSSKNKVDRKLAMAADSQDASGILSDDSSGGKGADQWPEPYSRQLAHEQALDHSDIYADFNEKSQISSFREKKVETSPREEKEIDMLKSWLEGMKQQGEGVYDDLEKKAKATCERLEMLDEEQAMLDDRQLCLNDFQVSDKTQSSDSLVAVQQRLRKMHEEKKSLALEAASELRRRISERSAARKVFTLMKREMDAYAKVMDKEKAELQSKLEEEIARRESSWMVKLDKIRSEERELRERVMNLQEENSYIQREISTLSSRDGNTKGRIKELESQVDSYRTRAEQAEAELDALHQAFGEKESEARNLRKIVERLPELCSDYEMRVGTQPHQNYQDGRVEDLSARGRMPSKLQRDLSRLSILELALQSEMKVLKGGPSSHGNLEDKHSSNNYGYKDVDELQSELDRLQNLTGELQDENNLLSVKLRLAIREKEELRKALREAEEDIHDLREEGMCRGHGEENHRQGSTDMSPVDRALDLDGDSISQGSRKSAGYHSKGESTSQLHARESQILNMKHEFGKQEDVIRGLEHSLSVAGKTVEAQKVRIMRLSARNEELVRLYHSKENEVQDLRILNSAEAESRRVSEQELNQMREQAVKCKQELRAQDLNCRILKEKLGIKEAELEQRNDEISALEHRRDWLESEVQKLQRLLSEANQRVTSLEHQCEDHLDRIKNLEGDVEDHVKELVKLKEQLPRVLKERDDLSHEAEQMGREALRLGAEVEVLRRKVHELDEDVMVRDGQLSILCNALEDRE